MDCGKTFSLEKSRTKQFRKAAEQWLLDRSTLRRIEERSGKAYTNIWRHAQTYAEHIPEPIEVLEQRLPEASRVLLLDGTWISIRGEQCCVHIAYDTGIGVVDYWIDDTENKTAYSYVLARLEEKGYQPVCVVSDEHTSIVSLIAEAGIPHQYCLFHLLKSLRRLLNHGSMKKDLPVEHQVLYSRIKGILKTTTIEEVPERVRAFRALHPCWQRPTQRKALKWFAEILPDALTWLSFVDREIPRTTALLENLNGQIEQRLKTFRGVKAETSLRKILKILFYFRNFK